MLGPRVHGVFLRRSLQAWQQRIGSKLLKHLLNAGELPHLCDLGADTIRRIPMKGDEVPRLQAAELALGVLRSVELSGLPYLALVKDLHRELLFERQRKLHLLHGVTA